MGAWLTLQSGNGERGQWSFDSFGPFVDLEPQIRNFIVRRAFRQTRLASSLIDLTASHDRFAEHLIETSVIDRNVDVPYGVSAAMSGTADVVELPHHLDLRPAYKGMYVRCNFGRLPRQHCGTQQTVGAAINLAFNWWKSGHSPTMRIGGRPHGDTVAEVGTQFDCRLVGMLPGDPGYSAEKQRLCALVCWYALQLGVQQGLFADADVCHAVNELAEDLGISGRMTVCPNHNRHFRFGMTPANR